MFLLIIKWKKNAIKEIIEYFSLLMVILSSGSMFFTIMNVRITLIVLLMAAVLLFLMSPPSKKSLAQNLMVLVAIGVCYALNLVLNSGYTGINDNTVILFIRLGSLMLIQSSIQETVFLKKYVRIMYVLACVSLICFAYTMLVGPDLPFLVRTSKEGIPYMYTFYHTVGYRIVYPRNAGVFWEAPAFAIFLAIALLFLVCRQDVFREEKKQWRYYLVLIIAIITTMSVYAYIYLAFIGILMLVTSKKFRARTMLKEERERIRKRRRYYIVGFFLLLIIFFVIEARFQLITHKLVNRGGSYTTRFNDTYYSLLLASERLFTGYGISNSYTVKLLAGYNVVNNSNGLAILLLAVGLPMLVVAAVRLAVVVKQLLNLRGMQYLLVLGMFFLFHFSEHLWLYTLFISFLFNWRNTPVNTRTTIWKNKVRL